MADEADMRNELADLQTRADQIADEVQCESPGLNRGRVVEGVGLRLGCT